MFLNALAENLRAHRLWSDGSPDLPTVVVVGVSGGADSMALFHGLAHLAMQAETPRHWQLHVAHLDHALRPESTEDASFVAAQAASLGLSFHAQRLASDALDAGNLEQAARQARYAFLTEVAVRVTPTGQRPIIATAHHADDQAETLLLHLVRGAGLNGLGGMRWATEITRGETGRTMRLVRPLLNVRRVEIEQWLESHGIEWRHDVSNDDTSLARNRLRHLIVPQLETLNPQLVATLGRTADVLAGDADRLHRLDHAHLARVIVEPKTMNFCAARVVLATAELTVCDVATQRGLLRAALESLLPDLHNVTLAHVDRLRQALTEETFPGGPHPLLQGLCWTLAAASDTLPRRLSLHRAGALPFSPAGPHLGAGFSPTPLDVSDSVDVGQWRMMDEHFDISHLPTDWRAGDHPWRAFLDAIVAKHPLVTTPENLPAGVQFAPLGMGGRHKHLGDFFTDRKISVALRPGWPLIVDAETGEILWVCGLQPGHAARITAATSRVLMLEWEQV